MSISVENKKILIIDDDISIRLTLKKLVSLCFNFKIYTSDDGVQGLGYSFILKPDLIIIDSTLPKYSGRELIDYLLTNKSFINTPIILLNEGSNVNITEINNLSNFYQFSKLDKEFPHSLVKRISELTQDIDVNSNEGGLTNIFNKRIYKINNYLSRRIIKHSNISDIKYSSNLTNNINYSKNIFKRLGNKLNFLTNQFILSIYLSIFLIIFGRRDNEENIDQRKKDLNIFRSKIYPSIGLSIGLILFVCFQISLILVSVSSIAFLGTKIVNAASYTWDGGGLTNNWSDCDNWSTNICPVAADTVTFNGTSTKDSVIDASWGGSITSVTISAGYSGTITQERGLTISSTFTTSSGTFNAINQSYSVASTFTMNTGSTFTASSGITSFGASLTINGGTFNHNSGTVSFTGVTAGVIRCNNVSFNFVTFQAGSGSNTTITDSCTLPLGNNPTFNTSPGYALIVDGATLTGTGNLTIGGGGVIDIRGGSTTISGFTGYITTPGTITTLWSATIPNFTTFTLGSGGLNLYAASQHLNLSNATTATIGGTLTWSAGTITAPTGIFNLNSNVTISGTTTFNHNNGTVNFGGSTATLSCNNITFNSVSFTGQTGPKTVNSNCNLPLGNNPTIPNGITLNGTLTGTGTLTRTTGTLTLNTGSVLSGFSGLSNGSALTVAGATIDFSSYSLFTIPSTFTLSSGTVTLPNNTDLNGALTISGGTFNAPSGNMTLAGNLTVSGTPTFNHNSGSITFDGGTATLSCNNVVFSLVSFTHSATVKTVNSNCSLPLGNNPSIPAGITLNGILSGTGLLTTTANQVFTINTGAQLIGFSGLSLYSTTIVAGATLDFSSYITFSMSQPTGILTLNSGSLSLPNNADLSGLTISGGTFNAPSGNMYLSYNLTVSGTPTFNHNNGVIHLDGSNATLSCGNINFNLISINTNGIKTVNSNCNLPLGDNPSILGVGNITLNGSLSGTGILNKVGGLITLNSGSVLSGFNGLTGTSSGITVAGATVNFSSYSTFTVPSTFTLSSGTVTLPNNADLNGALTISGGTFNAPSGSMSISGALTISGTPTFNHNNGTITFDGSTATLSCNNVEFNLVSFIGQTGRKTINSNCNLPLGNDPTIPDAILLKGTLKGTGTFTSLAGSSAIYSADGGYFMGFSRLVFYGFTIASGIADFSTYDSLSFRGMTINAGTTFVAPPLMDKLYWLDNSKGGTFNHNNGTAIFDYQGTGIFMLGSTIFNNLEIYSSEGYPTVKFQANSTITVLGSLKIKGTQSNTLELRSGDASVLTPGQTWNIDVQGTAEVEYVDVSDSNNIGNVIQAANRNVVDSGNNTGWNFNNPTITNISITNVTLGSFTTNKTPTINFNISDPNTSDTVSYTIQIDNNSDFNSPEYEYTSTLGTQGDKSHTLTTPLSDNTYYLRIKGIDNTGGDGGYINANSGIAFGIDTTIPVGYVLINNDEINTTSRNVNLILPVQSDLSGVTEMKIGEDLALTNSLWETYSYNKEFTLSPGEGEKSVYAKFKDLSGNESLTYIDTINYKAPIESTVEEIPDENPIDSDTIETLRIRILDQNNNPLSNLNIKLLELNLELTTDDNGYVEVPNISRGEYLVLGEFNGEEFEQLILADPSISEYRIILQTQPVNYILVIVIIVLLIAFISTLIYLVKTNKINNLKDRYNKFIKIKEKEYIDLKTHKKHKKN